MPDTVELSISRILKGLPLECEEAEICDYSLEEQNEAMESQGITVISPGTFVPVLGDNVCYIVACVLINEQNEVLLMQEAKKSCAGKWYLPAGRMEKGETIVDACLREVLEETGLKIECTTMFMVECAGGSWIRFVFTGKVVGGKLKTTAEADEESLQAKWVGDLNEVTLRGNDIQHLIDTARELYAARKSNDTSWHADLLPSLRPYPKLLLRLVVLIKKRATNRVHILLSERTAWHLPTCEIHPLKSLHSTLRRFMIDLFGAEVPAHRPHGLLLVEHDPSSGKDGLCLTLLVSFRVPLEEVPIIGKCVWHEISKELGDKLIQKVGSKNSAVQVHVIR